MPIVRLDTGFNIEIDFRTAAFHQRILAWGIDLAIQFFYLLAIYKMAGDLFAGGGWSWLEIVFILPVVFYNLVLELLFNGQTPGKKLMKISVTAADGGQPSFSQYALRWIFRPIDMPWWLVATVFYDGWPGFTLLFAFGGMASYFYSGKSQRIGDLLAGTLVIDNRATSSWNDTAFMELTDDYTAKFPEVMRLSDRDINTIKQLLLSASVRRNNDYLLHVAQRIKTVLGIDTHMDELDFMETLLKDYNHLSSR
ncbi:MAG: RDD family protein [Flavihumibacter sp.]